MKPVAHLCLGTASWGEPYNGRTPPSDDELKAILDMAEGAGIRWLDTAEAYGQAATRLRALDAQDRFHVVTKVKVGPDRDWDAHDGLWADVCLIHMEPDVPMVHLGAVRGPVEFGSETLWGLSAYNPEQALTAIRWGARVVQVPWNRATQDDPDRIWWHRVQAEAYGDGVLFFGRQPFNRGADIHPEALKWAVRTNPRGWCVVGVESVTQLEQILEWYKEAADE